MKYAPGISINLALLRVTQKSVIPLKFLAQEWRINFFEDTVKDTQ